MIVLIKFEKDPRVYARRDEEISIGNYFANTTNLKDPLFATSLSQNIQRDRVYDYVADYSVNAAC